jgi:hypothetical protein
MCVGTSTGCLLSEKKAKEMKTNMQLWLVVVLVAGSIPLWGSGLHLDWEEPSRVDTTPRVENPIEVHFYGGYPGRIDFWDVAEQQLIKSVDLVQSHPFNGLPFKTTGRVYGSDRYLLQPGEQAAFKQAVGGWTLQEGYADEDVLAADGQIEAFSRVEIMKEYTVVTYNLYLVADHGAVVGIIAEYVVYDKNGKETGRFRTDKSGLAAMVSADGQYVVSKYGGMYSEDEYLPEGIRIYEVKTGDLIWEYPLAQNNSGYYFFPIHDYVVVVAEGKHRAKGKSGWEYRILKYKDHKVYHKEFESGKYPGLLVPSDFSPDHVTHYQDSERMIPVSAFFESDFELENPK